MTIAEQQLALPELPEIYPRLKAFARKKFPRLEPEDPVHGGVAKFLANPKPYDSTEILFRLLCTTISQCGLDEIRREACRSERAESCEAEHLLDLRSAWGLIAWELGYDFEIAVKDLTRIEREILMLRLDELTFVEIAKMLDRSDRGVRMIFAGIKAKLEPRLT